MSAAAQLEDEDLPEDIEDSDRYLAVPSQHDLDLRSRLARTFAAQELPDDYDMVTGFFRRRGAYSRFKNLLQMRGWLTSWYEFDNRETEGTLLAWCAEHDVQPLADGRES